MPTILWGRCIVVSAADSVLLRGGQWFESDCEHWWSTGEIVVDVLLRARVISSQCSPCSLSQMHKKLCMRVKWGLNAAKSRTNKLWITLPLLPLVWYLNPPIPVIGCTAVGIRNKTIEMIAILSKHLLNQK